MADNVVVIDDTVAAQHIPGCARNVQRLATRVALNYRHLVGDKIAALVPQPTHPQTSLQSNGNLDTVS